MEKFGLDIKLIIAQITNFLIFYFVFKKFIAKPFERYVADEQKKEHEKRAMMNEMETKYQRMKDEELKWQEELQKEKDKILHDTKKVAEQMRSDTLAEAKKDAEEMIHKAQKQIADERHELYDDVKRRTIDLSTYIVEKGLKEYLTDNAKKDLTKHIITNLGKDISDYEN